jgi:ferredoxin
LTSGNRWHLTAEKGCKNARAARFKRTAISPTMADPEDKNEENVGGKFYVDSQCIDCDLCRETAPNNFTRSDDEGYSYVFKQAENDEETAQCLEAMEGCPVEAIGDDGGS